MKKRKHTRTIPLVMMIGLLGVGVVSFSYADQFQAAAVKVDITPDPDQPHWLLGYYARQSKGVHDHLFHRIVVMNDGKLPFVLVSTDIAGISPHLYDLFCEELERETGIHRKQFWWTVTHTHSAPEVGDAGLGKSFLGDRYTHEPDQAYASFVTDSLLKGIQEALAKLEPARLAVGTGMSLANINRRAPGVDGKVVLGLNPDGPVDRKIGLLRLERPDGSLIALVANYAMHGTFLSALNLEISADAQGAVASYVEEKLGAPMLYINGAAGNIAPIYTFNRNFAYFTKFNVLLGDRILAANRATRVDPEAEIAFEFGEITVETPMFPGLDWPPELEKYRRVTASGEELVRLPVQFLKLRQDTVLWSAPLELFCEMAMEIRQMSPFTNTFYFGYANGWLGYLPTAAAYSEGGYEIRVTPYTEAAQKDFTQAVITYLQGLP